MENTIIGKIISIGETVNVSKTGEFLKRELILDMTRYDRFTGEPSHNYAALNFQGKHCDDLDGFKEGDLVEVAFSLNGRKWENGGVTKYIMDIVGYRVEKKWKLVEKNQEPSEIQPSEQSSEAEEEPEEQIAEQPAEGDDLPF